MIVINNIDKNPRNIGPHQYVLRINAKEICSFSHNREDGLATCLRKAANAVAMVDDKDLLDFMIGCMEEWQEQPE